MIFLLKVVNLEAICTADCNTSINPDKNINIATDSVVLRSGMAALVYVSLG